MVNTEDSTTTTTEDSTTTTTEDPATTRLVEGGGKLEGFAGLNPAPVGGGVRRRRRGECMTKHQRGTKKTHKGKKGKGKKGKGKPRRTQRRRRNSQRRRRR